MKKHCEKCGKEIPKKSADTVCDACQNKKNGMALKILGGIGAAAVTLGSIALFVVTKGKIGGDNN